MWLFALSAYDALSGAPKLAWGTPLVVAGVYFIFFTLYQGYKDYSELQRDMKKTDQECHDANLGGQDGNGGSVQTPSTVTRRHTHIRLSSR